MTDIPEVAMNVQIDVRAAGPGDPEAVGIYTPVYDQLVVELGEPGL